MIRSRLYAQFTILLFAAGCGDLGFGPGQHDFSAALPGNCALHFTSANNIVILGPNGLEVPSSVEELAYDANFILAKQQHLRPRCDNDDYGDPIPGEFSYWILDVTRPKRYGPFDEERFLDKRRELKLDPNLTLRVVSSFDPRNSQGPQQTRPTPPGR